MFERNVLVCVILKLCLSIVHSAVIFDLNKDAGAFTYRLSNESIPLNYFIHLETDIHTGSDFNYSGYVIIDIQIVHNTNILRLHERQINVHSVELWDSKTIEIPVEYSSVIGYDFLDIALKRELKASDEIYKLKISFTAPLREIAQGFYRSYYIDDDGNKRWLAATQFEPTNARYAFPCYDEPGLKSTFELEIKHHLNYTAISNYNGIQDTDEDGEYVITKFDKTTQMSTYLLAFIVSDYISNDNLSVTPKQKVYTRPNAINHTKLGLEEGVKIIKVLEEYVGINYKLEKLDQASIPDFQPGAMENWGLVTYKEDLLLFIEETGSLKQKLDIITTIAHEYGHQFFGNLVTPKWWEYIWLNEGFATLMEHYLPHLLYPDERYMDLFVINRLQYAMMVDGLKSTRPMTHYAESPSGISGLFDTIAYHKSGSVLRMIQHFLTDETFSKGLKLYLEMAHPSDVVVPDDLFTALTEVNKDDLSVSSEYDLKEIFESWTLQKGYPLLTVTQNQADGTISLTQQLFVYQNDGEISDQLWIIPFNYYTSNGTIEETITTSWMPKQAKFDLELSLNESEWIIFNIQQTGYYRVNYDTHNWELIMDYLSIDGNTFEKIGPINRAQLIDDSFNLARAGIIPYEIPLKMMQYLAHEFDYIPWAAANTNFEYLNGLLINSKVHVYWAQYINELINSTIDKIGYTPKAEESNFDIFLRSLILDWSCKLSSSECLEFVENERSNYFSDQEIDVNLKEQILCYALDELSYAILLNRVVFIDPENNEAERVLILNVLGCRQDVTYLEIILFVTVVESEDWYIRRADRNRLFTSVLSKTKYGLDLTIGFVKYNYEDIQRLYSGNKTLNNLVVSMASFVRTVSEAEKFETDLLNPLQHVLDESAIEASKNIISERLLWHSKYGVEVKKFLFDYYEVEDDDDDDEDDEDDKEGENGDGGGASNLINSIGLLVVL